MHHASSLVYAHRRQNCNRAKAACIAVAVADRWMGAESRPRAVAVRGGGGGGAPPREAPDPAWSPRPGLGSSRVLVAVGRGPLPSRQLQQPPHHLLAPPAALGGGGGGVLHHLQDRRGSFSCRRLLCRLGVGVPRRLAVVLELDGDERIFAPPPPRRAGRVHADRCRDKIDQQEQQLISYG